MTRSISNKARIIWVAWVRLARSVGTIQVHLLLTVLYMVALFPFGLCVRFFGDALRTHQRPAKWASSAKQVIDFTWALKQ